ncbi:MULTISPECIES: ABC-type zinc uptake system zinc chaperone [Shewanella]|uniref:ABC-type zinc uptake system zinc chaperone n=1 Tax=Shewanella scandinavica TaxID=3063538 RepID=A0ABU3FVY2_9GAMM|nr:MULTISPECIES: ABC-type zinc uptake system zinc chaperone [Shewanella]EGT3625314.1 ABC-type zinc uptake system zinc chaperone [Morganella morganii]MBU1394423.1 ABC-type zinc uptake system zinc chaperone [Gammaproteobacteria bacterium]QYX64240.1 ABC-type zinc uptake system zinc chaperone [Shewanella putrefaciens]MBU1478783.1 ABC-type zinc uptake system zinc chaperone [Gammaproteobacteria bacterium]MBU2003313.1 ABC-type zinc uptake system zinc chaperone [Gammaproteobacteria bacterium]
MRLKRHIRRTISIWLSAILILLSFAASAHSVTHLDDGAKTHCTLCFHQHQLNKILLTQPLTLNLGVQHFDVVEFVLPPSISEHVSVYRSRAPPVTL